MNYAIEITNRLDTVDVFRFYGFELNNKGFICCPFHNEKTPSCKVYSGNRGYHCFGCGEHGDIITFVQKLFNLSFQEALKKLDADFSLNLYGKRTFEQTRSSYYMQKSIEAKRLRRKSEKERAEREYWEVFDEWKRLDDNRKKYRPKTMSEKLHPLFVESLQKLEYQNYLLDLASERRMKCE